LLGCGSLRKRERDQANYYKQNQVKGTSNKVRSNHGVNTLFHFDRAPAKQTAFYWQRVKNVKTSLRIDVLAPADIAVNNPSGEKYSDSQSVTSGKAKSPPMECRIATDAVQNKGEHDGGKGRDEHQIKQSNGRNARPTS
jgi:hypothetical protein